jgi:membrane-bound lytic murein transglycosylase MltF
MKRSRVFLGFATVAILLSSTACRREEAPATPSVSGATTAAPTTAPASAAAEAPVPLQDLAASDALELNQKWTGDFDEIASGKRRFLRALVPFSRTLYYNDGPEQRGIAFEALRQFETELGEKAGRGAVKPKVVIIPTTRDRLLTGLAEGYGDVAMGGFTVTEARQEKLDFSQPTMEGVRSVVVTGPAAPLIASLDDLSGKEIHVRKSSSYWEDLAALNERFRKEGKPLVRVVPADELLEDEDILQMVDAGIIPATVVKDFYAKVWSQVYDKLAVHEDLVLRADGQLAWAMRKNTPLLAAVVNDFVRTHRTGTLFGNVLVKRYLGNTERLRNPTEQADLQRFREAATLFQKYAGQYGFDWLAVAAQAYQESRIDQSLRSSAGAVGVMQIKPATAADVGVSDVTGMDNNIQAGVKYFHYLIDRYYKDEPMSRLDKSLFAFASYNAGPAKVRRLREKAKAMGLDPNVWFNNVELVAGREIGRETVDYVSNIYKYYTAYKAILAQRELRTVKSANAK